MIIYYTNQYNPEETRLYNSSITDPWRCRADFSLSQVVVASTMEAGEQWRFTKHVAFMGFIQTRWLEVSNV